MRGTLSRRPLAALLAAVLAGLLASCGDPTTTHYCTFNSDCPESGPAFCVNGICRSEQCQQAGDCSGGQQCIEGVCSDG